MRIVALPLAALALIGASEPDAPEPRDDPTAAAPGFSDPGCAEGVPNFNWEACASKPIDCASDVEPAEGVAVVREGPPLRKGYDPETDAPMEMHAVHRVEDGCPVIELTSGETIPVPPRQGLREVEVAPAETKSTSPRT